jgi:hypothetical protein
MTDLGAFQRVLDVGGWFKPISQATHVVDLMPYETRGARLNENPIVGERFGKDSWTQINFLQPDLRLPFPDDFFDYVNCGQTIEDLTSPGPLPTEMSRVGKCGAIECPSRLHEQTVGVRDRESSNCGHPHHHWIAEKDGAHLVLYSKKDSLLERANNRVPLTVYEDSCRNGTGSSNMLYEWSHSIQFALVLGPNCEERSATFVANLRFSQGMALKDKALRFARRARTYIRSTNDDDWWAKIVEQSRPFSKIPIS